MHLFDFVKIARNRSMRLAIDELVDFIVFDLAKRFDFANRESSNKYYIPSPSRVIRQLIRESNIFIDPYRKNFFVDCAAGKGKPSLIAIESGFDSVVAVERDFATFEILNSNLGRLTKTKSQVNISTLLSDFLFLDSNHINVPAFTHVTFWLFDLKDALQAFFSKISELCMRWNVQSAVVLLISESNLPIFEGWEKVATVDFGYDDTRIGYVYTLLPK